MTEPLLRPVPMLDLTLPAIPARSRLYPLEPIGAGTPLVESLTSYLTRLAYAHCVPLNKLAQLEFAPLINKNGRNTMAKFTHGTQTLNGAGEWTSLILMALARLTEQLGLQGLTMYPWRYVLAREKLLRPHLAWCPSCYQDWQQSGHTVYNPLLWHLEAVEICPHHRQRLRHHCPHPDCQRQLPSINNRGRPGYCPYCRHWLGAVGVEAYETEPDWRWQTWLTGQLAELFTAVPHLQVDPQPQTVAWNLRARLETAPTRAVGLARQMGMAPSAIYRWLNHAQPPRFDLLAKLCYAVDQPLLAILTAEPNEAESLSWRAKTKVDIESLRQRLEACLQEMPPYPAEQVARRLGVSSNILIYNFPEQYRQLVDRYAEYRQSQQQRHIDQLEHTLQAFWESDETPPPSLREVARRLQLNPNTVMSACPEWSRLISQKYKSYRQARQAKAETGLQQLLAAETEPPLSVLEAAARLGETTQYLYKHFPDLCRQITQRRASYQPPPPPRSRLKDHPQLQRQFAAILAAQEQPPPSLREVARRLGCGYTTLRQRHADLCEQLRRQTAAYQQVQVTSLPARLAEILAAPESPAPSLRAVASRLGVPAHLLSKVCPETCAEILRRAQAERQAAKQQRQVFLAQVLAESEAAPPALSRVAKNLNTTDGSLQDQFPVESTLIVQRSQTYKAAEKQAWQEVLQAALAAEPGPPSLAQLTRQLGHPNSKRLRFHFPELCRQIVQWQKARLADQHQAIQVRLEAILAEDHLPPLTLVEIARRLGYNEATLKRRFPAQVQTLLEQRRHAQDAQKLATEQTLQSILAGEPAPSLSMKDLAQELGYTYATLQAYFPDLTAAVQAKRQAFVKARSQERRHELMAKVRFLTQELHRQGLEPTLRQVALRLPSPKLSLNPLVRQAWREARREIGLST